MARSELCWLPARCVVAPRSTLEVSLVLRIVTFTHARFALRGGGHNPNTGWSSVGSIGLLVDLYQLKNLSLSEDKKIISIGPGNRWADVYRYLDGTEVSAAGGRVPEVGVSGLLLRGKIRKLCHARGFVERFTWGLSYFPSETGLSCDNVQNFEVQDLPVIQLSLIND